ncbi:hypothetical protein C8I07_11485 [Shewanella baltica]|nr:hypothetical protein C8I07_11485 [Shewanella baltica]
MDVLVELTGTYLQRVTGVTVQKPAAGNWEIPSPKATIKPFRTTQFCRIKTQAIKKRTAKGSLFIKR